jgi:hypothetical protein
MSLASKKERLGASVFQDSPGLYGGRLAAWLPFGMPGAFAVALMAAVAFTLGQFAVFGLEFLAYWRFVWGGWLAGLIAFSVVWGTGIEAFVWRDGGTVSERRLSASARALLGPAAALIAGLVAFWLLARRDYQCLLVTTPSLSLLVFAITAFGQLPIIRYLREAGRDRAAFAALLPLTVVMMFFDGEMMAVDHYRKGLAHFQNERRAIWSIPSSDRVDFFFDYAQREVVLKAIAGSDGPLEVRRSLAGFACE